MGRLGEGIFWRLLNEKSRAVTDPASDSLCNFNSICVSSYAFSSFAPVGTALRVLYGKRKAYPCINNVVRQLIILETVTFDSSFDHRQKFDTQQFFYP